MLSTQFSYIEYELIIFLWEDLLLWNTLKNVIGSQADFESLSDAAY